MKEMWLPTPALTFEPDPAVSQSLDDLGASQTLDISDDESSLVQEFDDHISHQPLLSRPGTAGPR